MLSEPAKLNDVGDWKRGQPAESTAVGRPATGSSQRQANGSHSNAQGRPLTSLLDSSSRFREYELSEADLPNYSSYQQPRWEDGKASVQTERGSVPSSLPDNNLVLTSQEQRGGLVIKKFREFQRVSAEVDARSGSNRSITSESARPNSVRWQEFRLTGVPNEMPGFTLVTDAQRQLAEAKSERALDIYLGSNLNESQALTDLRVSKQLVFDPVEMDRLEVRSERVVRGAEPPHILLADHDWLGSKQGVGLAQGVSQARSGITDRAEARSKIRGEIAEVVLNLEKVGRFEGELVDGRMNGYGRLFDSSDRLLYEGDFIDDLFEGVGVLYNHNVGSQAEIFEASVLNRREINLDFIRQGWDRYEGLFRGGRFHGRGYLYYGGRYVIFARFLNGEIESGCVLKDLQRGSSKRLDIYGPELISRTN